MIRHLVRRNRLSAKLRNLSMDDGKAIITVAKELEDLKRNVGIFKNAGIFVFTLFSGSMLAYPLHAHLLETKQNDHSSKLLSQQEQIKALAKALAAAEVATKICPSCAAKAASPPSADPAAAPPSVDPAAAPPLGILLRLQRWIYGKLKVEPEVKDETPEVAAPAPVPPAVESN